MIKNIIIPAIFGLTATSAFGAFGTAPADTPAFEEEAEYIEREA